MLHLDNLPDTFDEHLRILERLEGRAIGDLYERIWALPGKVTRFQILTILLFNMCIAT